MNMRSLTVHAIAAVVLALFLAGLMAYPFLPGSYDGLAAAVSTMVQVFGVVGLPLVPVGALWFVSARRSFGLALTSTLVGTGIAFILALIAVFTVGYVFGGLVVAAWGCVLVRLVPSLARLRRGEGQHRHPVAVYLVIVPVLTSLLQVALAGPLSRSSRERAMANAGAVIADIEQYRVRLGRYPVSLHAQHADYSPGVVGVETYFYAPSGESFNLSFEQPRFVPDRMGTREWVVYNPRDEHQMFSHAAWLLTVPDTHERAQGWYAFGGTGRPHWRYFWFD